MDSPTTAPFFTEVHDGEHLSMSRINVELTLFQDNRFAELGIRLGNRQLALGFLVMAWALARRYWIPDMRLIPKEEWNKQGMTPLLIECGFAREEPQGIYVCGTRDALAWYFNMVKQRSEAGKKSADKRRKKKDLELTRHERVTELEFNEIQRNSTKLNGSQRNPNGHSTNTKNNQNLISYIPEVDKCRSTELQGGDKLTLQDTSTEGQRNPTKLNENQPYYYSYKDLNTNTADASAKSDCNEEKLRNDQCSLLESDEAFDIIFSNYPRRKGDQRKKRARQIFSRQFKSDEKRVQLESAVLNYLTHCELEKKVGTPYVMQMATFIAGPYEEYINSTCLNTNQPELIVHGNTNDLINQQIAESTQKYNAQGETNECE